MPRVLSNQIVNFTFMQTFHNKSYVKLFHKIYAHADTEQKRIAIETATEGGIKTPINISPKRFTINNEDELKRLVGLK